MFYFTTLGYIFGIDCQTTLQVQEKLISRLPVEIYVQLRCYCCVRILGRHDHVNLESVAFLEFVLRQKTKRSTLLIARIIP